MVQDTRSSKKIMLSAWDWAAEFVPSWSWLRPDLARSSFRRCCTRASNSPGSVDGTGVGIGDGVSVGTTGLAVGGGGGVFAVVD